MKVAVFGTAVSKEFIPVLDEFFNFLKTNKISVQLFKPFYEFLTDNLGIEPYHTTFFSNHAEFDTTLFSVLAEMEPFCILLSKSGILIFPLWV